ncbi:polymorphic toxin type 50 domain-containing protein [Bacillus manliponensis]|uniref:polymorphic toxin type 50 domain-containing protein n=1 Tax=Bacillus manliponensis TaxID=574376 RepID=UPI003519194A
MSLNMYIGEVQAQTESMNAFCNATIQGMEEVIRSIDSFAGDVMLQGKTYDSAKTFFVQTYRQLAQGIIYLCEELIRQNNSFPADFQAEVATVDVIEQEIREQIRELQRMIAEVEAMSEHMTGMDALLQVYHAMKRKLEDKLERLYQFNYSSSENYRTALELASSIAQGLSEVQSGKGFQSVSGTFHIEKLNMEWAKPIQAITEEKARIKEEMALKEQEENRPWYQKTAISAWEFLQGLSNSVAEANLGSDLPMGTDLESKKAFQAGNFAGNIVTSAQAIVEILGGIAIIGGSNAGTVLLEVGTGGLATPIAIPANVAITAAGGGVVTHGGFVWYNTVQNAKDTLQKFQSYGKSSVPKGPYLEVNGYPAKVKPGAQEKHIPNTPNYKQEVANGKNKSIFYGDNKTAQELLDKFAGKGTVLKNGRERVDFGQVIGKYYDRDTGEYHETTKGLIHYGKDGAHIVPARP